MKLENWSIVATDHNPFASPEMQNLSLHGEVYGHPKISDGSCIVTSSIVGRNNKGEILTNSGNPYELGLVDPAYEEKFRDAKARLLDSLEDEVNHAAYFLMNKSYGWEEVEKKTWECGWNNAPDNKASISDDGSVTIEVAHISFCDFYKLCVILTNIQKRWCSNE